jgi:hypothetical protein
MLQNWPPPQARPLRWLIIGVGNGTSDSVAAMTQVRPVDAPNGEFHVPQAVMQALGLDFFDKLIA